MLNPKPKVLIAEDDEAFARQLGETLTGENYDVALAHDGSEALQILQNHTTDLGFIDLEMGFQQNTGFGYIKCPSHPLLDHLVIFIQTHI